MFVKSSESIQLDLFTWASSTFSGKSLSPTSIGMKNNDTSELLAFEKEAIAQASVVCDVVAIPVETPLVQEACRQRKHIIYGSEIATLQSLEQFILYTSVCPSLKLGEESNDYARNKINAI